MPKTKSHSASKKRFKLKKNGKIKFSKAFRRHLLTKKSQKRKLKMRKAGYVLPCDTNRIARLLSC